MEKLIERYFEILLRCFEYDINVYSQNMWMYYWLMVPAIAYTVFFSVKWAVLTTPLWMPFSMIFKGFPIRLNFRRNGKSG